MLQRPGSGALPDVIVVSQASFRPERGFKTSPAGKCGVYFSLGIQSKSPLDPAVLELDRIDIAAPARYSVEGDGLHDTQSLYCGLEMGQLLAGNGRQFGTHSIVVGLAAPQLVDSGTQRGVRPRILKLLIDPPQSRVCPNRPRIGLINTDCNVSSVLAPEKPCRSTVGIHFEGDLGIDVGQKKRMIPFGKKLQTGRSDALDEEPIATARDGGR